MAKNFYGLRLDDSLSSVVETVAKETHSDKTRAIVVLLSEGWLTYRLKKALDLYSRGRVSIDKAAEIAGLTVHEMMQEAAKKKLTSPETINELEESLEKLLG